MKTLIKAFELSHEERVAIEHHKYHYEHPRGALIEALKVVQKYRHWVPDEAVSAIAEILNIPSSDVEEVATFYSQIFRQPVGRHIIRYCDSVVCYITGYQKVLKELERLLNIKSGQTTNDAHFTLLPTCCLGNCDHAPTIMIDDDTYAHVTSEDVFLLLEKYK
ncbi:NADH-quinone oxidoreductase subunit NuoE [Sodalis sp. CWE]|uniref:NADH-quinone oxidoreductase subunit NuoE n=1 Tax=Sodalis sp. CWE TaxID=2803816 RepID=UPI001C7D57F5|nr:NADH-quinone oxidoreductase subunit NuoE [Sodalis sp. CWE]MBX4181077.1 NADH-quinone oxidoreductase subunit NuoE [Sodalis sp. CWE]